MASVIIESLVFAPTVTVPDDADTLDAASVTAPGVGFQAVADRTVNLSQRTGGALGAGEFAYVDAVGALADKSRTRVLSPFAFTEGRLQVAAVQFWTVASFASGGTAYSRTSQSDFAILVGDISKYLPIGATLTLIEAMVEPGFARAGGSRMLIDLARQTPNWGTPAIPVAVGPIFAVEDDGTTNVQVISSGVISEAIARDSDLVFRIRAGNNAGTNKDDVHAVRLSYDVPGPNAF